MGTRVRKEKRQKRHVSISKAPLVFRDTLLLLAEAAKLATEGIVVSVGPCHKVALDNVCVVADTQANRDNFSEVELTHITMNQVQVGCHHVYGPLCVCTTIMFVYACVVVVHESRRARGL